MKKLRFILLSDIHGNTNAIKKLYQARSGHLGKFSGIIISGDFPITTPFLLLTQYILRNRNLSRLGYSEHVYKGDLRNQFINFQINSIKEMMEVLQKFQLPLYYIPGNVETRESITFLSAKFPELQLLEHNRIILDGRFLITGLGGSLEHLGIVCDHEFSSEDFKKRVHKLKDQLYKFEDFKKILVFHEPPKFNRNPLEVNYLKEKAGKRGYSYNFPIEAGSKDLYDLVIDIDPVLVINGHYHEYSGKRKINNSLVVNPGALATYNYATLTIKYLQKKHLINPIFYKIYPSRLSFINFIYQKRSFNTSLPKSHY